ncbi:ATP-binding protein [Halorhodospira halophila]|uniref:Phage DNA replication protein (Predicted replicative helicase loader) n=1 Tax=Halorhodospira halophila (strain DSM 244 / SL1) TaxID=349124 RepID=A1WUR0_HALHL|nr:ATP-binding protein [Halorhodospira halophila]ABM61422.1 phage DNA replication protein (predicted replicative helicase loader) [Halorhodospira halophila SL1]MBK1728667.1 hypothetical protein [Halorhodospira halophila]
MQSIGHALNSGYCEQQEHCPEHGHYSAIYTRLGDRWVGGQCPHCLEAQRERQRREDLERRREWRTRAMLRLAGIPARYQTATFDTFEAVTEQAGRVRECCRRYTETFPERLQAGTNLILSGGVGTGKTHLACAMARRVINDHQRQAHYTSVSDAVRQVRRTYDRASEQSEQKVFDWLAGVPLLVLDEVGVQTGSEHERMVLFEVFNRRYSDMRPTVVISNLGYEELTGTLGERVMDRLLEDGTALQFTWDSYRRQAG